MSRLTFQLKTNSIAILDQFRVTGDHSFNFLPLDQRSMGGQWVHQVLFSIHGAPKHEFFLNSICANGLVLFVIHLSSRTAFLDLDYISDFINIFHNSPICPGGIFHKKIYQSRVDETKVVHD